MKTAIIRSSWMPGYGYRLDCQPYLGGALETKVLLERLPMRKEPLHTLTAGFDGGIYNGPKFSRTYVETPEYGVPFVGSSSMLYADLSDLPLLSKKQAYGRQLRHLELQPGMALISCSGTIGKMVYARQDMVGKWASQHILKVVADPEKIRSGYLYAYLSCKFGVPLVVSGTYGSIIQSLGPDNIADLPVPRLDDKLEEEIHNLVEGAAELRSWASEQFAITLSEFEIEAGLPASAQVKREQFPRSMTVESSRMANRFDANFHSPLRYKVLRPFSEKRVKAMNVGALAKAVVEPARFKRIEHDDTDYNAPLFGTGDIGNVDPQPISWITAFKGFEAYTVGALAVMIPRSGQLNGIIGTATLPIGGARTGIVSEHAIRIFCQSEADTGYMFLALRSQTGRVQLKARAFGSSIPTLDVANISAVLIPELSSDARKRFGESAFEVAIMRDDAIKKENLAREILVAALEVVGRS